MELGKDDDEEARVEREKEILKSERKELEETKKSMAEARSLQQTQPIIKPDIFKETLNV